MYRMAEMMEGKRSELAAAIAAVPSLKSSAVKTSGKTKVSRTPVTPKTAALSPAAEVDLAIDRLVCFAGWADKFAQVLGCNNPVSGPYYNFTVPEPTGVIAVVTADSHPLLGLVALLAPVICAGNAAVVLASSSNPIPAAVLGEVFATSDLPGGVVNILTGERKELLSHVASHRDIDGVHACVNGADATLLRGGVAENLKRVVVHEVLNVTDPASTTHPWLIEPFVEMKTIWHPASV